MKLSLLILFLLAGCGSPEQQQEKIRIGMTYDEVEKIEGKPAFITRGRPRLRSDYEALKRLTFEEMSQVPLDSMMFEPRVTDLDEGLYVRWAYTKDIKRDTFLAMRRMTVGKFPNLRRELRQRPYIRVQRYYIVFDAASGRVSDTGYFPIDVIHHE